MSDSETAIESLEEEAKLWQQYSSVITRVFYLSVIVFAFELLFDILPTEWHVSAIAVVFLFLLMGGLSSKRNDAVESIIGGHLAKAERLREKATLEAKEGEYQQARKRCDDAETEIGRSREEMQRITNADTKSEIEEKIANSQADIEDCRKRIRRQKARDKSADSAVEIEDAYEAAENALERGHKEEVINHLKEADTLEAEVESTVASIDGLAEDEHHDSPTPTQRIQTARESFVESLSSELETAEHNHEVGVNHLGDGRYEPAVERFDQAESLFEDVRDILPVGNLSEEQCLVAELADGGNVLQLLPDVGAYREDQLADAGYETLSDLRQASRGALTDVEGIGVKTADQMKQSLAQFSLQDIIDDRLASVREDRDRALKRHVEEPCERIATKLETVETLVSQNNLDEAQQTLDTVASELDDVFAQLESLSGGQMPGEVQSLQAQLEDQQQALERAMENPHEQVLEDTYDNIQKSLGRVNGFLSHGNVEDAEQALTTAETELEEGLDRIEAASESDIPARIESLRERVNGRRDDVQQVKEGLETLDEIDDSVRAAQNDIDSERGQSALTTLSDAREQCQMLINRDISYLSADEIENRLTEIENLRTAAEKVHTKQQIQSLLEESDEILDEAMDRGEKPEGVRKQVESNLSDVRDYLAESEAAVAAFDERIADIEARVDTYAQAQREEEKDSQAESETGGEGNVANSTSTREFAELTGFQRDLLVIIAGLEGEKGLAVKEELETYYDDTVNHGRLYPNLDTLVEKDYLDKFELNNRSNGYRLTDTGQHQLEGRLAWQRDRTPGDGDHGTERKQIAAAIDDVADELGRMPKRNEFLDRTDWEQADVTGTFESWNAALEAGGIDVEEELIAELKRVAESVDGEPNSGDMNRLGAYNSGKYSAYFGSWADGVAAADIGSDDRSQSTTDEQQAATSGNKDKPNESNVLSKYSTLSELPVESRYNGETAVCVVESHPPDKKKDARLTVEDTTRTTATFNVWSKHDCEVDWTIGEWYALSEIRLRKWDRNGETVINLSSSRDMTVDWLGEHGDSEPEGSEETPDDDTPDGDQTEDEGDGMLDEIVAEFDDEMI